MIGLHQKQIEHQLAISKILEEHGIRTIEIVTCEDGGWTVTTTRTLRVVSGLSPVTEKLITEYLDITKKLTNGS